MEQGKKEALEQEIAEHWQELQIAEEAKAARRFLSSFLEKRRQEILAEFQRLDSLDKDAFLMGALAVKSSLGAVDSLVADLEHTIKRGEDARFTLVQARHELSQLTETEETQ